MRKKRKSFLGRGFSLLEMVGIMIIISLCAIGIQMANAYYTTRVRTNMASQELSLIRNAVEEYRIQNGHYPLCPSSAFLINARDLLSAIKPLPSFKSGHHWKIIDERIIDPWGNPYVYRCESETSLGYILLSMGPNGFIDGNETIDDIYN